MLARKNRRKYEAGYEKQVGFLTSLNLNHHRSIFDDCYQLDFLTWPIDEAEGKQQTDENLTRRVFALNFLAIHTSSSVSFIADSSSH
jgi:NAD kinase